MDLVADLKRIVGVLDLAKIDYAVCGGLAVTIHGAARSTRDIDLLIQPEDLESVVDLVRAEGWTFRALPMRFDRDQPHERQITRVSRVAGGETVMLDLLTVTPFWQPVFDGRIRVETGDRPLWVVSLEGLAQMKRIAGRPQDLADLEKLGVQ